MANACGMVSRCLRHQADSPPHYGADLQGVESIESPSVEFSSPSDTGVEGVRTALAVTDSELEAELHSARALREDATA